MTEEAKKIIAEEMLNLSKEAQDAINAFAWVKITEEIGKKHLLNEYEIDTFQLETASFLLGLVDEDSYPMNIEEEVGTSKEEAKKISEEVFEKIFTPVADAITDNIKKSEKVKNPNWNQNLDFILSGGNYAAFSKQKNTQADALETNAPVAPEKRDDVKLKLVI